MHRDDLEKYKKISKEVRISILDCLTRTKSPHIGPSFSIVEILVYLYFGFMNISPGKKNDQLRDRFILSKGHSCPALYSVLYKRGFITKDQVDSFAVNGGELGQHPDKSEDNAIELSTGSLGHGLSVAVGMALAGRSDNKDYKVITLLSDGELNEGSVWEAVMFAGHHGLCNMIAMVDQNKMQALGRTRDILELSPIAEKWSVFGWHVQEVDGHDFESIEKGFNRLSSDKPNLIVLDTVKGKGVSFMENSLLWHYRAPDDDEYKKALKEISG